MVKLALCLEHIFENLFPEESRRQVFSVSEITRTIKKLLEERVGSVWISGEISGLKFQSSGHIYFTLKDEWAQIQCVLFRGEDVRDKESLKDGLKILIKGDLTVYEPRGQYQVVVRKIELLGIGALQIEFEKLKKKLQAEGLFDSTRKREIPKYPRRVGVATSPDGAAIRDILHVIGRRFAGIEIILAPCRVQGEGSALEIAAAIKLLNEYSEKCGYGEKIDVILVTRGGGSLEDLWAFNEEIVARAVFSSAIPVISAVGHEIDFTICDFVADLRAATPSAAAEILTANYVSAIEKVGELKERLSRCVDIKISNSFEQYRLLVPRLQQLHPKKKIEEFSQYLDDMLIKLNIPLKNKLKENNQNLINLITRLHNLHPEEDLRQCRDRIKDYYRRLDLITTQSLRRKHMEFRLVSEKLKILSPENAFQRGFSITIDPLTGRTIKSIDTIKENQEIKTILRDGEFNSVVKQVSKKSN